MGGPYMAPAPYNGMFYDKSEPSKKLPVNELLPEGDQYANYIAAITGVGGIPFYQKLGKERESAYYISQYDGEIRYFDAHFKKLLDALKELGIYDKSVIIFTSDHGEGMGEHDYYFAHGENLYNSLIRVPLIIKYGKKAARIKERVRQIDIVPTILKFARIKPRLNFRGENLLKKINEREVFSEKHDEYAFIKGDMKLILHLPDKRYSLFDVKKDPGEEKDLIGLPGYRDIAEDLKKRARGVYEENLLGVQTEKKAKMSEEEEKRLKSLGYL